MGTDESNLGVTDRTRFLALLHTSPAAVGNDDIEDVWQGITNLVNFAWREVSARAPGMGDEPEDGDEDDGGDAEREAKR